MAALTVIPTEHVKRPGQPVAQYTPVKRLPKRGDLAIHAQLTRTAHVGAESQETYAVRLGIVTSVSRDGQIKRAWFPGFAGSEFDADRAEHAERMGGTLHYVAAEKIDLDAILSAYRERRYPTAPHSDMLPPFSDNADARALIVAHKR